MGRRVGEAAKSSQKSFGVESQVEVFELLKIPMESSVDLMEQKVHDLDNRLKQMKEERDQVIQENEELQEQLDMTNTNNSVGMQKINELKNEVTKLGEEVKYWSESSIHQSEELKNLSDHMCDLNSLKESVKEHGEEIVIIKDDYTRMKTHINVSAKLELQTQERVYESRLHHLENVLEEMRHREEHFMHLAEETAVLKDQVDALRELSVMVLKDESSHQRSSSFPPSALILESPVRSQSNFSVKSDENTLEKELFANEIKEENEAAISMQRQESIGVQQNNNIDEMEVTKEDIQTQQNTEDVNDDDQKSETKSETKSIKSETRLMLSNSSPNPGIKVTGTLKLMKPFEVSSKKRLIEDDDYYEVGCFPKYLAAIWSTIFD